MQTHTPSRPRLAVALGALLLLCARVVADDAPDPVRHELEVELRPASREIAVADTMTLPLSLVDASPDGVRFLLHGGLAVTCDDPAYVIEELEGKAKAESFGINEDAPGEARVPLRAWRVRPAAGAAWPSPTAPRLRYRGVIHHPLEQEEEEASRSFSRTPGLISDEGAVLSGSTWWIPAIEDRLVAFRMTVTLPETWDAVSQGKRTRHETADGKRVVTWESPEPMDEAYLVAAPFVEYDRPAGAVSAQAFLREPDPNLAAKYLEATVQYLTMYDKLIGPYPYAKFALVENFWETGYGMPSFTLLGPKIIRFPFILHSSYPHEILHNWWGNSVFVDYEKGNWCEGLTAYLADHLVKEGQGKGEEYRRDTLKKYLDYVREGRDFPLTEFRSRHSPATEAVGYGKTMMLFHMLRRSLGDETFTQGLRKLYADYRFRRASFDDVEKVFSAVARRDLSRFFDQWVTRTGAPEIRLAGVVTGRAGLGNWRVSVGVEQVQEGPPYQLTVPVAFTAEGIAEALVTTVALNERSASLDVELPRRPLKVALDPQFDLFRRLDRNEIPPSIGQLMGAEQVTVILPDGDPVPADAWRELAAFWGEGNPDQMTFVSEGEIGTLPGDRSVWILGSTNRWGGAVRQLVSAYGAEVGPERIDFGDAKVARAGHCFVLTATHPADPDLAVGWIGADLASALPGLSRKLPHYGKYSYLAFAGEEPTNDAKGQWQVVDSPLVFVFDLRSGAPTAALPEREPLARLEAVFDREALLARVRALASEEMEGRGVGTAGLDRAAESIAAAFREAGLRPAGDGGTYFQSWTEKDGPDGREVTLRNVVAVLPGKKKEWAKQSVVLGAHYDHLGRGFPDVRAGNEGKVHPGADDNASGVAVLLETAKLLASELEPDRAIVFAAFTGEEWGLRGSRHYIQAMEAWPASEAIAMINLDTVGRLGDKKLTVLGSGSATEWIHIAMGIGFTTGVESTCVADDLGSSDQRSFLDAGVPAVQLFTGPHEDYHRPSDIADKVDADGLVKVATFTREALVYLAAREEPLTSTLAERGDGAPSEGAPPSGPARRVSLGTMPDFAFEGPGVKVASVLAGTPAEKAGIRPGDLVVAIDGKEIADLRAYSEALKAHQPGDTISIRLLRDGEEIAVEATLVAR